MANDKDPPICEKLNEMMLRDNFLNKEPVYKAKKTENVHSSQTPSSSVDDESSLQYKKLSLLRAKAYLLMSQKNFEQAAGPLEEIHLLNVDPGWDTSLLTADCFLLLGRERLANKAINDVKRKLLTSPCQDAKDVFNLANDLVENSDLVRAMILYRLVADIYQRTSHSGSAALEGIYACISSLHNVLTKMIPLGDRIRVLAIDYGIEYMTEMKQSLTSVQNIYEEKKVLMEAWCINWIGFDYGLAKEHAKSVSVRQKGADLLKRTFGDHAMKYRVYGTLLHNIAVGQYNTNRFLEARASYSEAITAKKAALDYESEREQQEDVARSETDLRDTMEKL